MSDKGRYRIICSEILSHEKACQEYSTDMLDYYTHIDNIYTGKLHSLNSDDRYDAASKTLLMFDSLKKLILDFIMCCHTKLRLSTPTLLLSFKVLEKYIQTRNQSCDYLQELIEDRLQFQLVSIVSLWISSKYIDTKYKHFNIDMLLELINAPQIPKSYIINQNNKKKTGSSMSTPIGTPKLKTPIGKSTNSKDYNYDSSKIVNNDIKEESEQTDQHNKIINKRNSLKRHVMTIELDILNKLNWCISDIPTNDFFIDISLRNLQVEQEINSTMDSMNFFYFDTNDINQLKFGSQMLCELASFHSDLFKKNASILDISEASLQVMKLAILNYKMDRFVQMDKSSLPYKITRLFNNCNLKDQLPFSFKLKYFPKNTVQYPIFLKSILKYLDIMNASLNNIDTLRTSVVPMTPITPDLINGGKKRNRNGMNMTLDGETLFTEKKGENEEEDERVDTAGKHALKKRLMCDLRKEEIKEESEKINVIL